MRFSGHETFAVRYAWLPKGYRYLQAKDTPGFQNEEAAMVSMGLGKNMVRALRFWMEVFGLAEPTDRGGLRLTPLAHDVFGPQGFDPFLEDPRTLWLLHWHLSVRPTDPICAWDILVNRWPKTEFTKSEAVAAFHEASARTSSKPHSAVTLGQHFDVFIRTYVPSRTSNGNLEETLDSPLVELALIEQVGERRSGPEGRSEPLYAFRRDNKVDVTPELFEYCVAQTFRAAQRDEATRTFRELLVGAYAPGQVFRLPEQELHDRLEQLDARHVGYSFQLSAVQSVLQRLRPVANEAELSTLLRHVYGVKVGQA